VAASGIPISLANSGLQPYFQYGFPPNEVNSSGSGTLDAIYPYASGNTVFAGNCRDNNPLGKDSSNALFYPGISTSPVPTPPNSTATSTIPLYAVGVIVRNSSNAVINNATVTAVVPSYASPYNSVCTSIVAGSGGTAGTTPTITLPNTAAGVSNAGMPLGHWRITAKCGSNTNAADVWVQPDGVYSVSASPAGAKGTKQTTATPIQITTSATSC
jgi:hypothetical protein